MYGFARTLVLAQRQKATRNDLLVTTLLQVVITALIDHINRVKYLNDAIVLLQNPHPSSSK